MKSINEIFANYIRHVLHETGSMQLEPSEELSKDDLRFIWNQVPYEPQIKEHDKPKVNNNEFEYEFIELLKKHNITHLDGNINYSNEMDINLASRTNTIEIHITGEIP